MNKPNTHEINTAGAGLPSKTGEPSGKGRDNAPPRK